MDFTTFQDKLASEDLKTLKPTENMLRFLDGKYADKEILGSFKLHETYAVTHFKQKLWHKLAFFKDDEWIETRVNSLKNKLPDDVLASVEKKLKKTLSIIKVESVILADGNFYFYVIAKISGKKKLLHISKEGEILEHTKYIENLVRLFEDDDDDDDNDDDDEDEDDEDLELDEDIEDLD